MTGASSGIGDALARQLAQQHARVLLVARRESRLAELADQLHRQSNADVRYVAGDITEKATRGRCLDQAEAAWGGLDLLINNAGIGALGPFAEASPERLRKVMEVDFFAPVEFIREALPLLRRGRQPMIVNVASVLGHRAVPDKSEYCAAKFAMHGISDALRVELAQMG
ncbi:MAG: SDR family NAD(P)-dependent oxidoreductase, partial [Planctomycetaceae bacterium]|nr:SDR family NAD(P)-dependent oxidoreductase [Planctomycetaceae bacterium]